MTPHNLPTTVEWLDGTRREYVGYDIEANGRVLMLTDPERRPVIIPLEAVREVTAGGHLPAGGGQLMPGDHVELKINRVGAGEALRKLDDIRERVDELAGLPGLAGGITEWEATP